MVKFIPIREIHQAPTPQSPGSLDNIFLHASPQPQALEITLLPPILNEN
jgi:hypothetical protein